MKYNELLQVTRDLLLIDSRTLVALGEEPRSLAVQLTRWAKAGKLIKLKRGMYLLPEKLRKREPSRAYLANLMVTPSYVSLEYALSWHGMIPEAVFLVQSVTTGRPTMLDTPLGHFRYRHIKQSWFRGYREIAIGHDRALMAVPEKALLDLIYLSEGEYTPTRIEQLRLQDVERLDLGQLEHLADHSGSPRVLRAARRIAEWVRAELAAEVTP